MNPLILFIIIENFNDWLMNRKRNIFISLIILLVCLFFLDLGIGSVNLSLSQICHGLSGTADSVTVKIVRNIRLMKAVVAVFAGIALSISGLMMQTLFRNPLAGPYVLGLSSGASLGVAIFTLGIPLLGLQLNSFITAIGAAGSAWIGAAIVLCLLWATARRIKDIMVILILGMCISSGISAIVEIMQYLSDEQTLKTFVVWTMGALGDVTSRQLLVFIPAISVGLIMAIGAVKSLNLLLLGEHYAATMGLDLLRSRKIILISTTLLAGTVTAFCGPVGFIGIVVPHITRGLFHSADHRILLPASALCGGVLLLFCDIISKSLNLPINSISALLGIPIIVWVVVKHKSIN